MNGPEIEEHEIVVVNIKKKDEVTLIFLLRCVWNKRQSMFSGNCIIDYKQNLCLWLTQMPLLADTNATFYRNYVAILPLFSAINGTFAWHY